MAKKERKIYTVNEVNTLVKVALEERLPSRLVVAGEISDFKHHGSGHCYFSLKDDSGVLACVMWASKFKAVKFSPENGMAVLCTGHVEVYTQAGKYQLYVDKMTPAGVGALQLAFEQMRRRLESEGLFKDEHKKALPAYPMRIGIITSQSGAAVGDIADSINNRWPCARLFLYPVAVQGEKAAKEIAGAIRNINSRNNKLRLDVLIVGRGGGSLEDLWAFNEEVTARAIFGSQVPIISAVGHEVDVTIADLVADARASTPTKAAVIAVPDMVEILGGIEQAQRRLSLSMRGLVELCGGRLETVLASAVFRNPMWMVNTDGQRVDEMAMRLSDCARGLFGPLREYLSRAHERILRIEPGRLLGQKKVELNELCSRAKHAVRDVFTKNQLQLTAAENKLAALSPKSVLSRGYSITTIKKNGKIVGELSDVEIGDAILTELAGENFVESEVKKK